MYTIHCILFQTVFIKCLSKFKFIYLYHPSWKKGSGALSGKMLLVWIVENNKIDDYFREVRLSKC